MAEIIKHINDTNASFRTPNAGNAKNTDLFLDNEHYELFRSQGEQITVRFNKNNLSQAILFIASILPRKYDNSAVHKAVAYSSRFVEEQLAMLDGFFMIDGKPVQTRTQIWNARKDVPKKNGEIDSRFYFNGLLEEFNYVSKEGHIQSSKFTIRNYLAGGYSDLHIKSNDDGIYDVWVTNVLQPYNDGKEDGYEEVDIVATTPKLLQQIFYGAPGTGKSHSINVATEGESVVRTTFHPDSDYSTFVGAYKPTTEETPVMIPLGEKVIHAKKADGSLAYEKRIVYRFVHQAFLEAYIKAWKFICEADGEETKRQYLVIEEINRGNCAQIFGDLFQLLDRNKYGYSEYPINADKDLQRELAAEFKDLSIPNADQLKAMFNGRDVASEVISGEILLLPSNLYIWATMNTSDQSLFPIDSAFKRRWDWKYIPIDTEKEEWAIKAEGKKYDWSDFLSKINGHISDTTSSEDKMLGFYFCKAENGVISAEAFVGKVVFYLWNDVFKDYGFDDAIFDDTDGGKLEFRKFYFTDGSVNEQKVTKFLTNLGVKEFDDVDETENKDDDN